MISRRYVKILLALLAALALAVAVGFSGGKASPTRKSQKKTIAFVGLCPKCTGQARVIKALQAETKKRGWDLIVVDTAGDFNKAVAGFNNMIQRKVDAIIDGVWDPYSLGAVIKRANDAHIPFVVNDGDWVPGVSFAVAMNSFQMGMLQAQWMIERLNSKGNVVMFTAPNARNVAERATVFKAIIGMFPNMKILQEHALTFAGSPVQEAQRTMQSWLARYGDKINAVWAAWDDPAIGAALAIDQARKSDKIFVIGNDAGPDAQEKIRGNSSLDGTVYVDYTREGQLFVDELARVFATGKPSAKWIWIDQPIVTRYVSKPLGQHLWPVPPAGKDLGRVTSYSVWPKS